MVFYKKSVFDLLHQLKNKSNFEALSKAVTSLSQLLFNLNHIHEVRSYFTLENPTTDLSREVYIELMSKIKNIGVITLAK